MKNIISIAAALTAFSAPAAAEVKTQSDTGFSVVHMADVAATPDQIWKRLIAPKDYWSKNHSWSGSVAGFYIDAQAGGCFCELIQDKGADGKIKNVGSVEHMRVIFASPGKVLRMQGALGPLQAEAVLGTLTVAMEPLKDGKGTKLSFSYVVGGYMRYKSAEIATNVDKVIGEQFASLIKPFSKPAAIEEKASGWSLDLDTIGNDASEAPPEVDEVPADTPKQEAAKPSTKPKPVPKSPAKPKTPAKPEPTDGR
jgi:hypothetical protein